MARVSPDQAAADWASRLAGSTDKIKRGIENTSVAPGMAAARQKDVWATNVVASKDKWAARVGSVSLQDWQQAALTKGLGRIASGAQASESKMASFMARFLPHLDSVRNSLPARGNLEQNIARSAAMIRGTAKFQNTGR